MTPPQKKVHYGRIKARPSQLIGLGQAMSQLNLPADAEVEIKMELGRSMTARAYSSEGIALGEFTCGPTESGAVVPLPPTA